MIKKLSTLLTLFTLCMLSATTVLAQENATEQISENMPEIERQFTIKPAKRNAIKPKAVLLEMKPSQKKTVPLMVENESSEPMTLFINTGDGSITANGENTIKSAGESMENVGAWSESEEKEVPLEPGEKKEININVAIPEDAPLGEYYGGFTAEKFSQDDSTPENGVNFIISTRVVLPVYLTVTDDPQEIPILQTNAFAPTPFFYGTVAIFLGSMSYLAYASRKEKKKSL